MSLSPFQPHSAKALFPDMPVTHLRFSQAMSGQTLHQIHLRQIQTYTAPFTVSKPPAAVVPAATLSAALKAPIPLQFAVHLGEPALPRVGHPIQAAIDTGSGILLTLAILVTAMAHLLDRRRDAKV